jgi:hypothetical protein
MPVFPKAEGKILALARLVIEGLRRSPEDFPKPPVSADELEAGAWDCEAKLTAATAADAARHQAHVDKDKAFAEFTRRLKAVLAYAEIAARRQPAKLTGLGWGPRRAKQRPQAPGEVRSPRIEEQGETHVILTWKRPVDGGRVVAYTIEGKRDGSPWQPVATQTKTRARLDDQPRGVELEYRVFAWNKVGQGNPSATVRAVL